MYSAYDVATTIKMIAARKNITLKKMLNDLNLGQNFLVNMAKGRMPISDNLARIADYLDCSIDCLLGREDIDDSGYKDNNTNQHVSDDSYYFNEETAKTAQEIFENRELRMLFDAARDADPEDLKALHNMALALKRKERGNTDDSGC